MNQPVSRKRNQRGVILLWGTVSMLLLVPMMGLAIDVGFLYAIKSKLQGSVDGAALASTRALSIGSTLNSQETTATAHATTWFNANFPSGYFGTYSTSIGTPSYSSSDQVMSVSVTATTTVDSFFMKWLHFGATTISATGTASRRTVVAMLVLDRSGSMCYTGTTYAQPCNSSSTGWTSLPCYNMVQAAKIFTGQFQEGTDYIGLVTFSDDGYIATKPVTNFQTLLGYSNASGSGTGYIDSIGCAGGTSTAEGLSLGYQLLYQTNLTGALNVLVLETDGLPNTLVMNFWDNTNTLPGLQTTSNCQDNTGNIYYTTTTTGTGRHQTTTTTQTGFLSASTVPKWTSGLNMTSTTNGFLSSNSYYSNIPAGMIASVSSSDPGDSPEGFWEFLAYFSTSSANNFGSTTYLTNSGTESTTATGDIGCANDGDTATPKDVGWFPSSDVFGNSLNPSYTYQSVTLDSYSHIAQSGTNPANWQNYHNAVLNATDNAAYNARSNSTMPATIFTIGLGGNSVNGPPDPVLLQRIANDPNGDEFNTTGSDTGGGFYNACSTETACATWSSQPQGTFIYAPSTTYLSAAFLRISSQVLRLSK